jgi:hypothetical protein
MGSVVAIKKPEKNCDTRRYWAHGHAPRGKVPGLGLTDKDVGLLRGVSVIGYSYKQGIPSFLEAHLKRTPG